MNVLFYIPEGNPVSEIIHGIVEIISLKAETTIVLSIKDLSHMLCWSADKHTIIALLAGSKEDLQNLVAIRHLLSGKSFILILPDRREGTTAMGHSLGPRFLTYADSNLAEVVAVLEKMIENYNSKKVMEE
ncbi:MAG: hypothetical protein JRI78_09470 [Deltaproteobacteria bacterium]|nr:hypothetical protein [Deltaproteobacteria bacterium]